MRLSPHLRLLPLLLPTGVFAAAPPPAQPPKLPVVQGQPTLASVNGEPITMAAFKEALTSVHTAAAEGTRRAKQNPAALLERMITFKLCVQEARNIGLGDDPGIQKEAEEFRKATLESTLLDREAAKVTAPEPAVVDRAYKSRVGVASYQSVLFAAEVDAKALDAKVRAGADFQAEVAKLEAAGKTRLDKADQVPMTEMRPDVIDAISRLKPGQVTPPVKVETGYAMLRLIEMKVPDDPKARREAEDEALSWRRVAAVSKYTDSLRAKYAKVDLKLVDSLDFDGKKPEIAAAKKDNRPVATIAGEAPITVAQLAEATENKFFHGASRAEKRRLINNAKYAALEALVGSRVAIKEALRLKLDQSPEFKAKTEEYVDGILFGQFVQRVVAPDVKVDDAAMRAYYAEHAQDYASPEMLRLDSLAFLKRADAEQTLQKYKSGSDIAWLRQNAPGQVVDDGKTAILQLRGGVFVVSDVDPEMKKALTNPRPGDLRLFAPGDGPTYLIQIREVIPSKVKEFDAVKDEVRSQVFNEKTTKVLEEWSAKLRAASKVEVFVTPESLQQIVKNEIAKGT